MTSEQEAREELEKLRKSMVAAEISRVIATTKESLGRALKSRYRWFLRWRDAEEELAVLKARNARDEAEMESLKVEFQALRDKIKRRLQ